MDFPTLLVWFAIALAALLFLEGLVERYAQGVCLVLTGENRRAMFLFSLMFLPGVALHELSHWAMAKFLRVKVTGFSLRPQSLRNGRIRMGYVETVRADPFRATLIGIAPLIAGTLAILGITTFFLRMDVIAAALANNDMRQIFAALRIVYDSADAFIWLYIVFTISNTMMPSASDRYAWPLVFGLIAGIVFVLWLLGWTLPLEALLMPLARIIIEALATVFTITIALNLLVLPILYLIEYAIGRITGRAVTTTS